MNVLVTGGGTTAPIDDVRTITNVSTGRFAAAITESCLTRGARVWHLHTPSALLPLLRHACFDLRAAETDRDVETELDRLRRLRETWRSVQGRLHLLPIAKGTVAEYARTMETLLTSQPIDVAFLAMAVSDYEPEPRAGKVSSTPDELVIHCRRTPKVIRSVRDWAPRVYLVGFKLLSRAGADELIRAARLANESNRANLTVANDLQSLAVGRHTVHLVRPGEPVEMLPPGPDLADRLVARVFEWVSPVFSPEPATGEAPRRADN